MERNFDDFDSFATDYRAIHNENIHFIGTDSSYFAELKVKKIRELEADAVYDIVDIGCGDGISAVYFDTYFPKSSYIGIDVSQESIEVAKQKQLPKASFKLYNGITIPVADNSADILFIACVLHHISFEYHLALLKEMYRVLKPGGRLYIFEHNPHNPVTMHIVNTCPFDADAVLLKPSYTKQLLKQVPFVSNKINFILFFPRKSLFKYFITLEKYLQRIPLGGQYFSRSIK